MVFSFFKKPPEKMVARPAAAPKPRAEEVVPSTSGAIPAGAPNVSGGAMPAAAEPHSAPPKDLAPLDFTTTSEMSDFGGFAGEIHVENDVDPIDADIEQVAVLYSNGQDAAAQAMLEHAVHVHHYGPGETLWLMLFDLYRLTNQPQPFDALSLEFATAFEKSPPAWRNTQSGKAAKPAAAVPAGTVLFKGDITGDNDTAFAALDQAVAKNPKLRVELTKVQAVDDLGAERLLGVLAAVRKAKKEIELVGRDALATLLESSIETGRRSESGCWLLLLELYQLMGKQEAFEDMAINYAVTFEMSPPSWEAKRVAAAEPEPVLTLAVEEDEEPDALVLRGDLKGERFAQLPGYAEKADPVVLDFSAVTRIDFVSAGTLVNQLSAPKRKGKRVIIRHPNYLVAELLGVVGLKAVAEFELAKI